MKVDYPVTPVIYVLPKIHKDLTNPPGRPIISGIGSLTEKISTFVDFFLKPVVFTLPSFVKDSIDMIQFLKTIDLPDEILFVTFDVESLYTNIHMKEGLRQWNSFLETHTKIKILKKVGSDKKKNSDTKTISFYRLRVPPWVAPWPKLCKFVQNFIFNGLQNVFLPNIVLWRRYIDDIFQVLKINCYTFTVSLTLVMNTYVSQLIMMIHVLVFWTFALLGMVRK